MKLQDFISKGFYINLDYRKDKKLHIEQELALYGLQDVIVRFSAIKAFETVEYIRESPEKMLQASIATARSHKEVIKLAKDNNLVNVLILEDDIKFYNTEFYRGLDIIETALDQLQYIDNWEILFLGTNLHDSILHLNSPNLVKCSCCVSTQAYILNSSTFSRILDYEGEITHMDVFLDRTFDEKYVIYPLSLVQKSEEISDIGGHISPSLEFWKNHYKKPIIKSYE